MIVGLSTFHDIWTILEPPIFLFDPHSSLFRPALLYISELRIIPMPPVQQSFWHNERGRRTRRRNSNQPWNTLLYATATWSKWV